MDPTTTLVAKRGELDEKRTRLRALLAEAGPEMDPGRVKSIGGTDAEKLAALKALGAEVTALDAEVDELAARVRAAKGAPDRIPHPGAGGGGVTPSSRARSGKGPSPWAGKIPTAELERKAIDPSGALQLGTVVREEPVAFGYRTLLDVIPVATLNGTDGFEYLRQTVRTNAAAPVARGAIKPASTISLVKVADTVSTIATVTEPIPNDYISDVARLEGFLTNELVFMVRETLEEEILEGTGAGAGFTGIRSTVGLQTQAKGTEPIPDAIHKAITKVRTGDAKVEPSHIAMNPNDWERTRLMRTADGIYIFGEPGADAPPQLFGVPVVLTLGLTAGVALVGDFTGSAAVFAREGVRVDWTEAGKVTVDSVESDLFSTNQKKFRAEGRWGLAVFRPAGFCEVTGLAT